MTAITPTPPHDDHYPAPRLDQVLAGWAPKPRLWGPRTPLRTGPGPAMDRRNPAFGVEGLSNLLGVTEIAARPWLPRASAVGSLPAVGMFLSTFNVLVTTRGPGPTRAEVPGHRRPRPVPDQGRGPARPARRDPLGPLRSTQTATSTPMRAYCARRPALRHIDLSTACGQAGRDETHRDRREGCTEPRRATAARVATRTWIHSSR
jgi:hypothetical protein